MFDNTAKILIAYSLGQATQLLIHAICLNNNMYSYRQVPFCIAGGFVILFAVISGVFISEDRTRKKEKKTYLDWAEIPEEKGKVVNPFAKDKK